MEHRESLPGSRLRCICEAHALLTQRSTGCIFGYLCPCLYRACFSLVLASFLPNIYQRWFCLKKTHNLPGTHYAWFQVSHNVIYYYSDDRSYELTIKVTVLQAGFCTPTYCNEGKNQKMCLIIIKFTSSLYTTVGSFHYTQMLEPSSTEKYSRMVSKLSNASQESRQIWQIPSGTFLGQKVLYDFIKNKSIYPGGFGEEFFWGEEGLTHLKIEWKFSSMGFILSLNCPVKCKHSLKKKKKSS